MSSSEAVARRDRTGDVCAETAAANNATRNADLRTDLALQEIVMFMAYRLVRCNSWLFLIRTVCSPSQGCQTTSIGNEEAPTSVTADAVCFDRLINA